MWFTFLFLVIDDVILSHAKTLKKILNVFIGPITFNIQAYRKSPKAKGVRL